MVEQEPLVLKICIVFLTVLALTISAPFCGIYWSMYKRSVEMDDHAKARGWRDDVGAYDRCLTLDSDTKWSLIYAYNAFLYLALSILSIITLFGAWKFALRLCGCLGHCFGMFAHLAGIIMTGIFRYNEEGKACAERV